MSEERRRLAILGGCLALVLAVLGVAVVGYVQDQRELDRINNTPVGNLGAPAGAAGCDQVVTRRPTGKSRSGVKGNHVDAGTKVTYPDSPPAFGRHWSTYLTTPEYRTFYTPEDRPHLERMVHSLEHGHTLVWYDDTIAVGSKEYRDLQEIAEAYADTTTYVNILPWTPTDGGPFEDGKHVVLTHWAGSGDDQRGVWEYCAKPSGAVIKAFVRKYPNTDSPEGGAP